MSEETFTLSTVVQAARIGIGGVRALESHLQFIESMKAIERATPFTTADLDILSDRILGMCAQPSVGEVPL